MTRAKAEPVLHIDDDTFRVTEWRFAPGAETGWHVHGHDYVIVPLTDGLLGLENPGGAQAQARLTQGVPYSRRAGVEHNVINDSAAPLAFLEVETLADAQAAARRAVLLRFMAAWNARDLEALMACMTDDCTFHASGGDRAEGTVHAGQAAVRAAYAALLDSFPTARWSEDQHWVTGAQGVSEWRFTGTRTDGRQIDVQGCDLFRFDGLRIARKDSYRKMRA